MNLLRRVVHLGRHLAAVGLVMAVAACGGGGDGNDDPGGGGGNEPGSMVPPPPALGDTLYTDAAVLRPLVDGATLMLDAKYQGEPIPPSDSFSSGTLTYRTTSRGGVFTETVIPPIDDPFDRTLRIVSGRVENVEIADLSGLGEEELVTIELRSPVRVGDQYVSIEKRYDETAIDVDGDRKADKLDIAVYSRVIGAEDYTPPGRPTLKTVRVDTVVKLRTQASSTGEWSDPVEAKQRKWYSEGLGVVRQEDVSPGEEFDEPYVSIRASINYWNGVDRAWGPLPPQTLRWADDSPFPGDAYSPVSMARMGNELVVTSKRANGTTAYHKIDSMGRPITSVTQSHSLGTRETTLHTDRNWVYISGNQSYGGLVKMWVTDALGNLTAAQGVTLEINNGNFDSFDGNTHPSAFGTGPAHVWGVWARARLSADETPLIVGCDLLVRAWDLEGRPTRPETILASEDVVGCSNGDTRTPFDGLAVSANAEQAVVTWQSNPGRDADAVQWYATVDLTGPRQSIASLGSVARTVYDFGTTVPLALDSGGGLLFWNNTFAPVADGPGVVRVRADASLVSPSTEPLAEDRLGMDPARYEQDLWVDTNGRRLAVAILKETGATRETNVQLRALTGDDPVLANPGQNWTTNTLWWNDRNSAAVFDDFVVSKVNDGQNLRNTQLQFLWAP